ncbi:unnamed protein product [Protopolystoma xenopodis]|uniref:Uncharacterized protein n=1 Tax=Protopolystoma xenopodis TaxID=117903 RepID=A0A3S5CLR8_9PLAT|nr:unnamed protein product [Protopolystoma xenopodis]
MPIMNLAPHSHPFSFAYGLRSRADAVKEFIGPDFIKMVRNSAKLIAHMERREKSTLSETSVSGISKLDTISAKSSHLNTAKPNSVATQSVKIESTNSHSISLPKRVPNIR